MAERPRFTFEIHGPDMTEAVEVMNQFCKEKRHGELTLHFQNGIITHITEKISRKLKNVS